jgi:hypothetical protein
MNDLPPALAEPLSFHIKVAVDAMNSILEFLARAIAKNRMTPA